MEKYADLQGIVGKTILTVEEPNEIMIGDRVMRDTNIVLTFSDGTKLKLASWDYEGYSSGIYSELESGAAAQTLTTQDN